MKLDDFLASRSSGRGSSRSVSSSRGGPSTGPLPRRSSIRRWDGAKRTTTTWDGVRRVCFPRVSNVCFDLLTIMTRIWNCGIQKGTV